jgi:exodeoxyribonuclease V alpha subunit
VGGSVLELDPVQLADVQTAFAMTVHKSQGSEYPTVVFILPPASSPLATRELVYTGATRAREHLVLVGDDASLQQALASRALRMTGLTDALR